MNSIYDLHIGQGRVRPRPDAMRPRPKENCEAEARDVA